MSLQEFQCIFKKELDRHIAQLEKHEQRATDGAAQLEELPNLPELRRLGNSMIDNILQRLVDNASFWNLDEDALNGTFGENEAIGRNLEATSDGKSTKLEQLKARCREMESELQRRQHEEDKRKVEVLGRFKEEYDGILRDREQDLLEIRKSATLEQGMDFGCELAPQSQQEFSDQLRRIQKQIAETKDAVNDLDNMKKSLEKIEVQQRQSTPPIEALLASTMDSRHEDAEDQALAAGIKKGEQVCKRLRRHHRL